MTAIRLRLIVRYAVLYLAGSAILTLLAYGFTTQSLRQQDAEILSLKLIEFRAQYRIGGLELVRREVAAERELTGGIPYAVRVTTAGEQTLLLETPPAWGAVPPALFAQAAARPGTVVRLHATERDYEALAAAVEDDRSLQVAISLEPRQQALRRFREIGAALAVPLVAISVLLGAAVTFRSLRPIDDLAASIRTVIASGIDPDRRRPDLGEDRPSGELDDLARLFATMLDRIEALIERMRAVFDEVAHELRTPLTRMRGRLELALQSGSRDQLELAARESLEQTGIIMEMFASILDVTAAESGALTLHRETVALTGVVGDAVELYEYVAGDRGLTVDCQIADDITVTVDRQRLLQAFANLVDNAIKYTPRGGRIELRAEVAGDAVTVSVSDTGIGIRDQDLAGIWERLYRGANTRHTRGLGLGLSFVKAVTLAHGGAVAAHSTESGATFTVTLPLSHGIGAAAGTGAGTGAQ